MLKILYASRLVLSLAILSQLTLEVCAGAENTKNSPKTLLFGGKGLRSFKVIDVDKNKKPVTSACYGKQHICIYLQPFSH